MRPLTPRDCAIVVAVPSTRDEFMRATEVAGPGSFVAGLLGQPRRRPEWVWKRSYGPIADLTDRVLVAAASLGVTVVRRATVADLARVIEAAGAVTLVAHWRFPGLTADDIAAPAAAARAVAEATGGPLVRIRAMLAACPPAQDPERALIDLLCREVAAGERRFHDHEGRPGITVWDEDHPPPDGVQRVELEAVLPADVLRRAGVVEFADGFQTAEAVIRAIPDEFAGVLDLLVCNSAVLGAAARQRRRRCIAVVNRRQAPLAFAIARYQAVIKLLAQRPQPYIDAVHAVHRLLIERSP